MNENEYLVGPIGNNGKIDYSKSAIFNKMGLNGTHSKTSIKVQSILGKDNDQFFDEDKERAYNMLSEFFQNKLHIMLECYY